MSGQVNAEVDDQEITVSGPSGPTGRRSRRRKALLIGVVVGVGVVGLSAAAVVFRATAPERPSQLAVLTANAPPEVAALVHEAAGVADRLVERFPDDPNSLNVLAWVHFRFGASDEAVRYWRRCLELNPDFVDAYCSIGSAARKSGNHEEAAACFRRAWELDPGWPGHAEHLAEALVSQRRMEEAIEVLEENVEAHPESTRSFLLLGEVFGQLNEQEKAKQSYEEAIGISPALANAYYGAAGACAALGQSEKSQEYMKKFKALKGRDLKAYDDALKTQDSVFHVRWGVAEACMAASKVYLVHGDAQAAEAHLRRGADVCPTHLECNELLARLYEQQGRVDEAVATWLRAKQSDPENMRVYSKLASLHVRRGEFLAAEEVLQNVIQIRPDRGGGYAALASLYLEANRKLPEAKRLALEAVEQEPVARHYFLLCLACQRNDDLTGARAAIERAVALEPGNREYRQMRELLQQDQAR
jgi:tetratricopeptide (TPR) repeat protein